MDNITLARLLDETASLLEIDAADPFRIRSYRRAAEAVEQQTIQLATLAAPDADSKALLAIPGIGKGMAANIRDLVATGSMPLRDELLTRYRPTMLELLRLPGMGPKTVALLWSALQIADIDQLEAAARAGHLDNLPRLGTKFTAKLLKGIEDHRKNSSRFRIDKAREQANRPRHRNRHSRRLASARPRNGRRPRPARHRSSLRTRSCRRGSRIRRHPPAH
jgi:DNA polymerase (family 10)